MAHRTRGNELYKAGDFQAALGAYNEAIEDDPTDAASYANKAAVLSSLGRFTEVCQMISVVGLDTN